jgi:ComF family protein
LSLLPPLEHVPSLAPTAPAPPAGSVWVTALLDLIFPPFCPVCERRLGEGRRDPLCAACWAALGRIAPPYCRLCGLPFRSFPAGPAGPVSTAGHTCGRCRHRPPPFTYARSAIRYEEVAREAVHALKFGGRRALARPLGDLLAEAAATGIPAAAPDLLTPVPLHPRRERERGFNQALLLAKRLGRSWKVPVRAGVLARRIATRPQTELPAEARRANVRDAFVLRRPDLVAGRHVVLIDDVFTTGSTVAACARRLKEGGASIVGVLTVARAV